MLIIRSNYHGEFDGKQLTGYLMRKYTPFGIAFCSHPFYGSSSEANSGRPSKSDESLPCRWCNEGTGPGACICIFGIYGCRNSETISSAHRSRSPRVLEQFFKSIALKHHAVAQCLRKKCQTDSDHTEYWTFEGCILSWHWSSWRKNWKSCSCSLHSAHQQSTHILSSPR